MLPVSTFISLTITVIHFHRSIIHNQFQRCSRTIPNLQIRAHLGLGLGCPIVGDHKYTHATEIGPPQKLPGECLQRLGIRQSQVRMGVAVTPVL